MATSPPPERHSAALTSKKALGLAIKKLRKRADLTQDEASKAMPCAIASWRRYEWGERDLSVDKLDLIASAINATRDELLAEQAALLGGPRTAQIIAPTFPQKSADSTLAHTNRLLSSLPVRDRLQAGAWLAADDTAQEGRSYPAVKDPRYPHAEQWICEVAGDSMNKLNIFDGDLVQVVDAVAIRYYPMTGDIVEVERLRFGGSERELTIKEVEVTPSGILLWPRSTNERWQDPLSLTEGVADGEEIEVRILAKVISSIRRF